MPKSCQVILLTTFFGTKHEEVVTITGDGVVSFVTLVNNR